MKLHVAFMDTKDGKTFVRSTPVETSLSFKNFIHDVNQNGLFFSETDWLAPGLVWRIWVDGTGRRINVQ